MKHSQATKDRAVRLYQKGVSMEAIRLTHKVPAKTIYRWLRAAGVSLRGNVNPSRTHQRKGPRHPEALVRKCVALYATMSAEQVSYETGVSMSTVLRYVRAAGGVVRAQKKGNLP